MPIEIRMPALSPTMTEGNLARWLKKEGDAVHSGDVIAEIETDKATMEYEAADEGRLGKIIVPEGAQGIKVNQPIALLLEEGEDPAALDTFRASRPAEDATPQSTAPVAAPDRPPAAVASTPVAPAPVRAAALGNGQGDGRVFASPLARRMAIHAGLDLAAIRGSGPQGRIVKVDVEEALTRPGSAAAAQPGATAAPSAAPVFAKAQMLALAGSPPFIKKP